MERRQEGRWVYLAVWILAGCLPATEQPTLAPQDKAQGEAASASVAECQSESSQDSQQAQPFTTSGDVGFTPKQLKKIATEVGFGGEAMEVDGSVIRVGEDVVLDAHLLVQGAYGLGATQGTRKGYRYEGLIQCDRQRNIQLRWAEGNDAPPPLLKKAFERAAAEWSAQGTLSIDADNTGDAITIYVVSTERWSVDSPCGPGANACALTPFDGHPGSAIYVRERLEDVTPPCDWNSSGGDILHFVALHELGHAIGIHHPGLSEEDSIHIDGTRACDLNPDDAECEIAPGYHTVMVTGIRATAACAMPMHVALGADDRQSTRALYGR